jgi:hypothetical protein
VLPILIEQRRQIIHTKSCRNKEPCVAMSLLKSCARHWSLSELSEATNVISLSPLPHTSITYPVPLSAVVKLALNISWRICEPSSAIRILFSDEKDCLYNSVSTVISFHGQSILYEEERLNTQSEVLLMRMVTFWESHMYTSWVFLFWKQRTLPLTSRAVKEHGKGTQTGVLRASNLIFRVLTNSTHFIRE